MVQLSVLDQSIAVADRPQADAISVSVSLAEYCEKLGYHRYWVSEHHNHPAIVGTAPEILIAAIASKEAAKTYNLNIISESIQTINNNVTRFVILKNNSVIGTAAMIPHKNNIFELAKMTIKKISEAMDYQKYY